KIRNTFIIFLVSGFWHGANWTFVAWGGLNALFFLPLLLSNRNRNNLDIIAQNRWFPTLRELSGMIITFSMTVFAWIFFRSESVHQAVDFIARMFTTFDRTSFQFFMEYIAESKVSNILWLLLFFIILEWTG